MTHPKLVAVGAAQRNLLGMLCLTLSACGGATSAARAPIGVMGSAAAISRARADSVRYPYTRADIDFMSGMISHHAQAIVMGRWGPSHGASPALIRLTERIINAQTDEIGLMGRWLSDRNQPVPEANPAGMKMQMGGMEHMMLMPGMLTDAQMQELDAARGEAFDATFLKYMIQHHRGAVAMVNELFSHRGAGQDESVFKFANDVEVDQSTEINRMIQMMLELGVMPPPPASSTH
ncbi:MAG: DUF305 domain-containing protein [Gemmatimonadetes bacterium]|nr:DUF305 domain-containing protein [Gemmatimonadota bacterium]